VYTAYKSEDLGQLVRFVIKSRSVGYIEAGHGAAGLCFKIQVILGSLLGIINTVLLLLTKDTKKEGVTSGS